MSSNAPVCDKVTQPSEKIDVKYDPAEGKAEQKSMNASYNKKAKQDTKKMDKRPTQKNTSLLQP